VEVRYIVVENGRVTYDYEDDRVGRPVFSSTASIFGEGLRIARLAPEDRKHEGFYTCSWCGVFNSRQNTTCSQCGGPRGAND
jgi:hypothetical protein